MRVSGVDGCRGGWLVVTLDEAGDVTWRWTTRVRDWLRDGADAVAVDIPIGLPEEGTRACDREARRALGRRGSTVYPAPVRGVLGCSTYAEARALLAARGGPSMSAQAFGVVAAVRAVDDAVVRADEERVVEAHPELAFLRLGGGAPLPPKKSVAGAATRVRLLSSWRCDVVDLLTVVPVPARLDDALDALACAWVATRWLRGEAQVLGDGARDSRGLPMRIVS